MSKKYMVSLTLVVALIGFSAQGILAQVKKSNSLSRWDTLKPKIEETFTDSGDVKLVAYLRDRTVELMKARAALSNVDVETAQRSDLDASPQIREYVKQQVLQVWSARNIDIKTDDIIAGWNIAKLDPNYRPFNRAGYSLNSWQGIRVSKDEQAAEVVVTGTMNYDYGDRVVSDSLDQSQIKLVKENGSWLMDETVEVFTGETQ